MTCTECSREAETAGRCHTHYVADWRAKGVSEQHRVELNMRQLVKEQEKALIRDLLRSARR